MNLIGFWLRLELRRRWRSLLVLALLVAIATGTVLTSVAGARRGESALDRLLAQTLPATAGVLPNQPGFDWDVVRRLPGVAAVATFPVAGYRLDGVSDEGSIGFPFDAAEMDTVERPVVLQGRLPDPTRVDEGVVSAAFLTSYHHQVGDTLTMRLPSPEEVDASFSGAEGGSFPPGPVLQVRIVGVVRSLWLSDQPGAPGGFNPSAALFAQYRPNLVGNHDSNFVNALVRLDGGPAALPQFRKELAAATGRTDIQLLDQGRGRRQGPRDHGVREREPADVRAGRAGGRDRPDRSGRGPLHRGRGGRPARAERDRQGPRQAVWAATSGPALAALVGTVAGVVAAVVASAWLPFGTAALVEPAPGIDVDALVLGLGGLAALLLVTGGSAGTALLSLRGWAVRGRSEGTRRRSVVASTAARLGLPVPVVIGARFALEPGRGAAALPVRPALLGAVTGVLGVLAAFTFSAGVSDAAGNPARFGQTAQLDAYIGFEGNDFGDTAGPFATISADPDVASILDARSAVLTSGPTTYTTYSYASVGQKPFPTVVLRGAMPTRPDQIVLGPEVADQLHVDVGDTIPTVGTKSSATLTVSGIGFAPSGPHNNYDNAAWVVPAAYDTLFTSFKFHVAYIAVHPGVDPAATLARLAGAHPEYGLEMIAPPEQAAQIREVQVLPVVLGAFLALLAVGAVGHALATAVRRRRHDVAVLRALGMTRWQARGTVVTQATLLAAVGLLFGVPLGLALGRVLWRLVADITPLQYVAPVAFLVLVLVVPLVVVIANALAAWPGRQIARMRIGHVLRAE